MCGEASAIGASKHRAVDVLIVGAGYAGLSTGYWLSQRTSASLLIVDTAPSRVRAGSHPAGSAQLPGLRFPKGKGRYPTKAKMQAHLADYARRFELPVLLNTRAEVDEPAEGGGFLVRTNRGTTIARHVVLATGPSPGPRCPSRSTAGR